MLSMLFMPFNMLPLIVLFGESDIFLFFVWWFARLLILLMLKETKSANNIIKIKL